MTITFTSSGGDFETYFSSFREEDVPTEYKAGAGLYQWLRPADPDGADWSRGACVGYQETMLESIANTGFEVARTFAVFGILMAVVETIWVFLASCFEMNRLQGIMFCGLSAVGTLSTAMTFMFYQSALCQTEFDARACSIDEGGLVMIGAVALWMITFCVSTFFAYPTVAEVGIIDFAKQDARDKAKLSKATGKKRAAQSGTKVHATAKAPPIGKSYSYDSQKSWTQPIPSRNSLGASFTPATIKSVKSKPSAIQQYGPKPMSRKPSNVAVDDSNKDAMEVYISRRLDRIEKLAEC